MERRLDAAHSVDDKSGESGQGQHLKSRLLDGRILSEVLYEAVELL